MKTNQNDLRYLLQNGWRLIGPNKVQSPDGQIVTNVTKAARAWRAKKRAQEIIDRQQAQKNLLSPLTQKSFWSRLFT